MGFLTFMSKKSFTSQTQKKPQTKPQQFTITPKNKEQEAHDIIVEYANNWRNTIAYVINYIRIITNSPRI